ncbi:MAG: PAS/PAC domain-containing protein [Rhodospirillaceae bacterium]|nr:MAG: PAS/PAC domain-containing protein [Rhodospirillaceae bacterium]
MGTVLFPAAALGATALNGGRAWGEVTGIWLLVAGALLAFLMLTPAFLWLNQRTGKILRRKQSLEEEVRRLEEMLTLAPDGYYCWHYSRGMVTGVCSRRLAVLLGLVKGTGSTFDDVLAQLDESSALILRKMTEQLYSRGTPFELELTAEEATRHGLAFGLRAATEDGTPLADIIWIRDATETTRLMARSVQEATQMRRDRDRLGALLDGLPVPVWLRDDGLALAFCNRAYAAAVDAASPEIAVAQGLELAQGSAVCARCGRLRPWCGRRARGTDGELSHLVIRGTRRLMAVTEGPIDGGGGLAGLCTVWALPWT